MGKTRKPYPPEFRQQMVELVWILESCYRQDTRNGYWPSSGNYSAPGNYV